jgi:hypothetical protein
VTLLNIVQNGRIGCPGLNCFFVFPGLELRLDTYAAPFAYL